jgi:hypothetical protein
MISIEVHVKDPNGNPISDTDQWGNPLVATTVIGFGGDWVDIGGGYDPGNGCSDAAKGYHIPPPTTPYGGPGTPGWHPDIDPVELLGSIGRLVTTPGTDKMVAQLMRAYGSVIQQARAMSLSDEYRIQDLGALQTQASMEEISLNINRLTKQLTRMNNEQLIKRYI